MSTRREFLKHTAAAGLVVATSVQIARAVEEVRTGLKEPLNQRTPHTTGARIRSVVRREETTLRLGGDGDNFHMSWAANDRQFVSVCDGVGWTENPKELYNSRLFAIAGSPWDAKFQDVRSYPKITVVPKKDAPSYYNFGTLALDGRIYQFLSTLSRVSARPDGSASPDFRFVGAKLIYSPDDGRTWCNQDGSTPVVWESWRHQSRESMVFFEEPQDSFSLLTVLQMGRNYEANRDGYVYVYAPNGNTEGTMNELVMFRVPRAHLLNRGAYEYFAGMKSAGNAVWVKDINLRTAVHTFPRGWVNTNAHPYAWHPSVAYNAPLGLYMMANWGMGCEPNGSWFGKPSYLGFWVAANPWGPWTQIHEETAWTPDNDPAARAYQPQISPKWIAKDGKSFWLVWTDFQHTSEFSRILGEALRAPSQDDFMRLMSQSRQHRPYYAFNVQRVDLVIT